MPISPFDRIAGLATDVVGILASILLLFLGLALMARPHDTLAALLGRRVVGWLDRALAPLESSLGSVPAVRNVVNGCARLGASLDGALHNVLGSRSMDGPR